MQIEEALIKSRTWIDQLIGKELQYITGRNTTVITHVDWDDEGKIFVDRGGSQITIRFERLLTFPKVVSHNNILTLGLPKKGFHQFR